MLEARAEQRQDAAGLAVEAAPEADDFRMAGARLGEPQRRLDRFGSTRVELRAIQVAGSELGDQSHQRRAMRSEEHTSELQSPCNLVCRLLLEKKKKK